MWPFYYVYVVYVHGHVNGVFTGFLLFEHFSEQNYIGENHISENNIVILKFDMNFIELNESTIIYILT